MYIIRSFAGPLKNRSFFITRSLKLGRRKGDIVLNDPSSSDPHAEITLNPDGHPFLRDLNSKNGIFINGKKKLQTVLKENAKFTIGKNRFQVFYLKTARKIWEEVLANSLFHVSDQPINLAPFSRPLNVNFLSGPQKGTSFCLTYGPRYFGSSCVDMPLLEPEAPPRSFALFPEKEQALFQTEFPKEVKLNREQVKQTAIKDSDSVFIGETEIKINF